MYQKTVRSPVWAALRQTDQAALRCISPYPTHGVRVLLPERTTRNPAKHAPNPPVPASNRAKIDGFIGALQEQAIV